MSIAESIVATIAFFLFSHHILHWGRDGGTLGEGVASESLETAAKHHMVAGLALGVDSAHIAARILTCLLEAHFRAGTVSVKDALGSTVWRGSKVSW